MVIARILDANLDRAREGLRVLEDWCRFAWEDAHWANQCKDMRQQLAIWHRTELVRDRDTPNDLGTGITHPQEAKRTDVLHLLRANCSRVAEALRCLEEFGKLDMAILDANLDPNTVGLAAAAKQMRYQVYALESALVGQDLQTRLAQARLYLVTSPVEAWLSQVEKALIGGVRLVQYRRKEATYRELYAEAKALKNLCDRYQALCIINDRVDLALDIGADGVHLGQTDMPVATARQLLGAQRLIGQSTTNETELTAALATSADYIGVGPVHATPTKAGKAAAGHEYVRLAATKATIPFFAIGGLDLDTIPSTLAAGATHVAVVRSLMTAPDPTTTARAMRALLGDTSEL